MHISILIFLGKTKLKSKCNNLILYEDEDLLHKHPYKKFGLHSKKPDIETIITTLKLV